MDILQIASFESLKRYWRRRRYQRLDDSTNSRKKLRVARLGNKKQRISLKIRLVPKLRLKFMSPTKLLAKFHEAYMNTMFHLALKNNNVNNNNGLLKGKEVTKDRPFPVIASARNEVVDGRLVLEIYKRIVSTRELAASLV